jgi:hypothetical protein
MRTLILLAFIGFILPTHSVFSQDLAQMLQGLSGLDAKLKTTEKEMAAAAARRDAEKPPLQIRQDSAQSVADKIFNDHNNKHEIGSDAFSYWNNEFLKAKGESIRLQNEIKKLEDAVNTLLAQKEQLALDRQKKASEIISLLIGQGRSCADALTEFSTPEEMAHCGQVDFDGQKKDRPPLDESNIKRGTNFFNLDPGAVIDESDAQSKAAKLKKIESIIKKSSETHSSKPIRITPPSPTVPAKEPSASERLKQFIKKIMGVKEPKQTSQIGTVRG